MPVKAKICGVSTPEAMRAALNGGAGWLGFVFFEKSPRNIAPDRALRLAEPARGRATVTALLVDPDDATLDRIAAILRPDAIQLHGQEDPARVGAIRTRTGLSILKALPVETAADLDAARAYESVCDHLLFDARPPKDAALPGGMGRAFDWSLLIGRRFTRPWFLAGGLDPWNVAQAVRLSGASLVDVSSGVERGPGLKDPALISAFLDAARRA